MVLSCPSVCGTRFVPPSPAEDSSEFLLETPRGLHWWDFRGDFSAGIGLNRDGYRVRIWTRRMTSTRRDTQGRSLNASALRKLFVSLPQLISRVFVRIKKKTCVKVSKIRPVLTISRRFTTKLGICFQLWLVPGVFSKRNRGRDGARTSTRRTLSNFRE